MSTSTATKTARKATLTERRALWTRDYRKAANDTEIALRVRDEAIVNTFRSFPDSEVTEKKTATGVTRTTKAVSDNQRAKDTLKTLAVAVDDKGKTLDIFGLVPQRVVQIVKAYRRAEQMTGATPNTDGTLSPVVASEEGAALVTALNTAARGALLGDKGSDALAEVAAKDLADTPVKDVVKAAEAVTREAIDKAKAKTDADKAAAKDKAKTAKPGDVVRPVVAISAALDALESALNGVSDSDGAADLDAQQKAFLLQRLENLSAHLR